ncbi:transcriptional regulator [Devosia pacifica]|uniref:Transcriptional regulator n=2 Tax=Devosia pacifica TaxID=1335967 RepID=A0A918S0X3_9HYPH|nr:transcriptional regulator [Devosia pacifica]
MLIKMRGAMTSAALGAALGITAEAARQQLVRLGDAGLVEFSAERKGVGRPSRRWQLTEAGAARFPDTHAALTVQLLDIVRDALGDTALDSVISERERRTLAAYRGAMSDAATLQDRVKALTAMRSEEGYMAASWQQDDGSYMLVENHCPICAAATACQGFCRAELAVFQEVLGSGAEVRRSEHILAGARRCAYEIRPAGKEVSAD